MLIFIIIIVLILAALLYKKFYGSADFDPETLIPPIGVYIKDCREYYFINAGNLNSEQINFLTKKLKQKGSLVISNEESVRKNQNSYDSEVLEFIDEINLPCMDYLVNSNQDLNFYLDPFKTVSNFAKDKCCELADILSKDEINKFKNKFSNDSHNDNEENKPNVSKNENKPNVSNNENKPNVSNNENKPNVSNNENKPNVSKNENKPNINKKIKSYTDLADKILMSKFVFSAFAVKNVEGPENIEYLETLFYYFAGFFFTFKECKTDPNNEALTYWIDYITNTINFLLQNSYVKIDDNDAIDNILLEIVDILKDVNRDTMTLQRNLIKFTDILDANGIDVEFCKRKIYSYNNFVSSYDIKDLEDFIQKNIIFVEDERSAAVLLIIIKLYKLRFSIRKTVGRNSKVQNIQDQVCELLNELKKVNNVNNDNEFESLCGDVLKYFANAEALSNNNNNNNFAVIKNLNKLFDAIYKLEKKCNFEYTF